jgi:hypothetical protein
MQDLWMAGSRLPARTADFQRVGLKDDYIGRRALRAKSRTQVQVLRLILVTITAVDLHF